MRLRSMLVAAIGAIAVLAAAAPALAHEEISPNTLTVGQPAYVSLTVANEKDVKLVKIQLEAPKTVEFGTLLEGKDGWATTRSSFRMTWDGTVKPENFESFRYEIEGPDQAGTLTYKITLSYADGTSEEHEVDVTAVAAGAGTGTSATTVTTATPTSGPPTTAAAPADSGSGSDGDSGTAKAALAVSIVALLVAAGALAVGARRSGANRASGGGAEPGAAQDW
jgi:uncharacterized protein YcnI